MSKRKDVYDINNNSNTEELVNYDSAYLNLISPNSLLTSEIARNYNDKNESIVAPQIAIIDKETNSATIDLNIKNNYTSTISEVTLLGRVPFEGNKYVVQGKDLGSNFTTSMNNTGIKIFTVFSIPQIRQASNNLRVPIASIFAVYSGLSNDTLTSD